MGWRLAAIFSLSLCLQLSSSLAIIMLVRRSKMSRHSLNRDLPAKSSTKMKWNEKRAVVPQSVRQQSNEIKRKFNVIKRRIKLTTDETKDGQTKNARRNTAHETTRLIAVLLNIINSQCMWVSRLHTIVIFLRVLLLSFPPGVCARSVLYVSISCCRHETRNNEQNHNLINYFLYSTEAQGERERERQRVKIVRVCNFVYLIFRRIKYQNRRLASSK